MKEMKRAIHIDFHTMPGITDFGANYDAEDFAETLKKAHVDYVNVFARCNIGFSYYPTKVGTPYPHLKGDMLGDTIKACHDRGIGVTAYFNAGLNHELFLQHPEYMKMTKDGEVYTKFNGQMNLNFFRRACYNTGYTEHLLAEIEEVLQYDPDGIFCDCFVCLPCYCPTCTKMMLEQGIDINDEDAAKKFAYESLHKAFKKIRALVPQDKRLILNSHPYEDSYPFDSHAELECLPTGGWGYDYMLTQAPYFRKLSDKPVYMTGRFALDWGDFGGSKPKTSMEYDVQDALMYGFAPSIGDHMHPRDGLNKQLYSDIGDLYSYVMQLEPYTEGTKPLVEAAILRNKIHYNTTLYPFNDSDRGAARMLAELKICFDIVNEDMDLSGYKLLVLPDCIEITDTLKEKLENFKGSILSTGKSIDKGGVWSYISDFSDDTNTDAFFTWNNEVYGQYVPGVQMHSNYGTLDYVSPYFQKGFDGLHGYFYIPPKEKTDCAAVAECQNKAHICFNIFEAYMLHGAHFHKALVKDILSRLLPERLINGEEMPSYVRTTRFAGANNILYVKATFPETKKTKGYIEDIVTLPSGKKISVKGTYNKVYTLPEMQEVENTVKDGYTEITLPQIDGFMPFILKEE